MKKKKGTVMKKFFIAKTEIRFREVFFEVWGVESDTAINMVTVARESDVVVCVTINHGDFIWLFFPRVNMRKRVSFDELGRLIVYGFLEQRV